MGLQLLAQSSGRALEIYEGGVERGEYRRSAVDLAMIAGTGPWSIRDGRYTGAAMRASIVRFAGSGIYLARRWGRPLTLSYGEILTAERTSNGWGVRLHTRTTHPVRIRARGGARLAIENELRRRGVRVVDEWGAIIAPTLEDFEAELARGPERMRQSSDNA